MTSQGAGSSVPPRSGGPLARRAGRLLLGAAATAWVLGVGGGATALWAYKSTPGAMAPAAERWPAGSRLAPAADRPTLVMLAHPDCPCTRASVEELGRLLGRLGDRVSAHVLFATAEDEEGEEPLESRELWHRAASIRGLQLVVDRGGREASLFGASTSGHVVLYDAKGDLRFRGGLTASRGHQGEGPGARRIIALVEGGGALRGEAPVFGCRLAEGTTANAGRTP